MNMRKIIAVLSAVLMLCAIVPMNVFAAPGDVIIDKNFDDGSYFSNGSNENGYMVFDATTANWANVYMYANSIKSGTKYEISFDCKANKASNINVKINNNWAGDTFKWTTNVTTEWVTYTCVINPDELATLTSTALLMFTSNTYAADGAVYHIDNVVVKEYTDPDTIGKITNGSFEDGTNGWSTNSAASLVADAQDGAQALQMSNPSAWASVATQTIPVEANASYEITWYSKRLSGTGAFNLIACQAVSPWTNYTKVAGQNWMNETSGNWVANSYTVNVGDNTSMLLKFTTEATNPGVILIDNVVVRELKDPSFDGYITNGDFETGKASPWTLHQSTVISADAAHTGDYGAHIVGVGNWGGLLEQDISGLEVGKKYLFSFWMKMNHQGVNVKIGDSYVGWYASVGDWTLVTKEFTATATTAKILINGGGDGNANPDLAADLYVDDFSVVELKDPSFDGYITNGDFECGSATNWSVNSYSYVAKEAAKDSNFGIVSKNPAGTDNWGGTFNQSFAAVVGAQYKVAMDYKAISKGVNLQLAGAAKDSGTTWLSASDWTHNEVILTATAETVKLNFCGGGTGVEEIVHLDNIVVTLVKCATCETSCVDGTCSVCGSAITGTGHNYVGEVTEDATCDLPGTMTYTCSGCGDSYTEEIPAWHDGNLTHVPAKEAVDCANPGNIEYYTCPWCNEYFTDANASEYINPWFINITVDCVRPEGVADCADWTCEVCGTENYGYGEHDTGVPACQDGHCSKCDQDITGYGHQNYDGPACLPGNCYYCGEAMEPVAHENGAWAPCQIGECAYGCGLTYPATADHVDEDGDDYCDTCWNHLNHDVDPCVGGECSICWTYVEGAHTYDNEFDTECNVCGDVREVELPISHGGFSVKEDKDGIGLAAKFDVVVSGMDIVEGKITQADYDNATVNGYKLISMGAEATNGVSTVDIPCVYLCDLEADTASFAVRIINIPDDKQNVEITFTPYYVVEIDGVETRIECDSVIGAYSQFA